MTPTSTRPFRRRRRGWIWAALLAGAVPGTAGPVSAQDLSDPLTVLSEAAARYGDAGAVCADFAQVIEVPLLDQRTEGSGRLCQAPPNLFSMRYSDPEGDLIVSDGSYYWIYTPSQDRKQVLRRAVESSSSGSPLDFRSEFLEDPGSKYEVTALGFEWTDGERMDVVALDPKGSAGYERAVLWIGESTDLIYRIELREENGSVRTVRLSGIELDPAVPEGTFSFTPPPGTVVITR